MTSAITDKLSITADLETPASIYLKLTALKPCFLLESIVAGSERSRYSYIGLDPVKRLEYRGGGLFRFIERELAGIRGGERVHRLPDGLVGTIAYDNVHELLPTRRAVRMKDDLPLAAFVVPRAVLTFDHFTQRIELTHSEGEREAASLLREVRSLLERGAEKTRASGSFTTARATLSESDFAGMIARAKDHIAAGDVFQAVLSYAFEGETDLPAFQIYRALRHVNPSPYLFFHDFGEYQVFGSSPEALVRLDGNEMMVRPIAGTRPRGRTTEEEKRYVAELISDEKENAEHNMLVDLARNDVGRVAKVGTVKVRDLRRVERYSHVMHLVSTVTGEVEEGMNPLEVFRSAFPAGTLSGAPKVRALQIIDDLEGGPRGFFGGSAGYFSAHGDMDHAITIRSMVLNRGKYSVQAGAGIVADSKAEMEYQEIRNKAAAVLEALRIAREEL
ncbi:MAG: anthranilate synthase component I family protein [Planctomycetes bacterium]|nr:anthranilate synthase component I family protein [Planctomycetota bacterium]